VYSWFSVAVFVRVWRCP